MCSSDPATVKYSGLFTVSSQLRRQFNKGEFFIGMEVRSRMTIDHADVIALILNNEGEDIFGVFFAPCSAMMISGCANETEFFVRLFHQPNLV